MLVTIIIIGGTRCQDLTDCLPLDDMPHFVELSMYCNSFNCSQIHFMSYVSMHKQIL
jgi:hypothetical protein